MIRINRYELEKHDGPYDSWGGKSDLLLNGVKTGVRLSGYQLLHQIETPEGVLFITDYDCPFEEVTWFTLVTHEMQVISHRWFGAPYATFLLDDLVLLKSGAINFVLFCGGPYQLTIRKWGVPYLFPRMRFKRIAPDKYLEQLKDSDQPLERKIEALSHAP